MQEYETPEGYIDFKLLSSAAFHEWNAEYLMEVENDDGEVEWIPQTRHWLKHPQRRKYQDIGFFPDRDMPGFYNLWRGFAVEPREGDCSKFLSHIHNNICQAIPNFVVG